MSADDALAAMHCRPKAPKLEGSELASLLSRVPGWTLVENRIEKTFRCADYYRTMAFVNAVASIAHREDHHPELVVHYDRCVVAWSTHSAGGVTLNDGICAAKTDAAAA
jgi:4a-hydroxytetrahydrobiopterin dehydratase